MVRTVGKFSLALLGLSMGLAQAADPVLNLYSARHYPTDEALYSQFTKTTGIKINRVDADDAGILARLKAEGSASPADLILLVDASRLWRAEVDGLFLPVKSKLLEDAIPANLRAKPTEGGSTPDLRLSLSGKLMSGTGSSGTPLKLSTAPLAVPTSSSLSRLMVLAFKIQSGIQLGPGKRRQVVKVAL